MNRISGSLLAGAVACGLLVHVPARAASEKVLYTFCSQSNCADGMTPYSGLTNVNGTLYGVTYGGGTASCECGEVFKLERGSVTVLHSFTNGQDGGNPAGDLLDVQGTLYGTATGGGDHGFGAVYALDPQTGTTTTIYSFAAGTDGSIPRDGLVDVKGMLYGSTETGGNQDCVFFTVCGTVFAVDEKTGQETVLHAFTGGADGGAPNGSLLHLRGNLLYGTTIRGGAHDAGVAFAIDRNTGLETVLHSFGGANDGTSPTPGLINVNGTLYGTTEVGGAHNGGTVFALNPQTGSETVVYSFCSQANCTDGEFPFAGLISLHGRLYGTTGAGGTNNSGTVFALDLQSNAETVLYSFCAMQNCTDGNSPRSILFAKGKKLFGTTNRGGGPSNGGVVFVITR
jgi:uncharacterized repeat protein (TIGR03803 family)